MGAVRPEAAPCGLIWTDDQCTRRAVRTMMQRRAFGVVEVDDVVAAVEAARAHRPDVIVVDLAMAGVLGLGVIGRLRTVAPHCSIVVLSSFPELDLAAIEAGALELVDEHDLRVVDRHLAQAVAARHDGP